MYILFIIILILAILFLFAKLTDPVSRFTLITSPFETRINKNRQIELVQKFPVYTTRLFICKVLRYIKSGILIIYGVINRKQPLGILEHVIIQKIHHVRFDPQKPFVITGGHFSEIYIRNMGIFYNALLDKRLQTSQKDWVNRQRIALQTIALDLALLENTNKLPTTFMPILSNLYIPVNVYTYPSDSLFGILYAIRAMLDERFIQSFYPVELMQTNKYTLQTITASKQLLTKHKDILEKMLDEYIHYVVVPKTHLVRQDIYLSSARDGIKRQSSFYDNVIAWATISYAKQLGVYEITTKELQKWRTAIINAFWYEAEGIFIDDLSSKTAKENIYSADILIVISSGFFQIGKAEDKRKLKKIISYIQSHQLDEPFPLRYSLKDNPKHLYFFVKYFARSYMGETIWSHWGIEYIKTLILLRNEDKKYLSLAKRYLTEYKLAIEKYGGYPELYDSNGNLYHSLFYRSVLHTGWVVNYEQAKMMYAQAVTSISG